MSTNPKTAPYGSWQSPITSDLIVTQSISLSEVRFDGQAVYWLEARPQEEGRNVVVRAGGAGASTTDIVPKPFNVRTRVHEYGGGAWTVALGVLYFSNFADGRLYRLGPGESEGAPAPLTRDRHWRFADGIIDHGRHRWIGVREDHTGAGQPVNAIVALDLAQPGTTPASSPMDTTSSPLRGCRSMAGASLGSRGTIPTCHGTAPLCISPRWTRTAQSSALRGGSPAARPNRSSSLNGRRMAPTSLSSRIVRVGGNLYRFTLATGAVRPIAPRTAEFGQPQWNFGMATYAFAGPDRIVCAYAEAGLGHLAVIDLTTGSLRPLDTPFTQFASLRAHGDRAAFIAGSPSHPASVVVFDLSSGRYRILKKATDILDRAELRIGDYLMPVEPIEFPTSAGRTAFGLFYRPHNADYAAPEGEKPPLLVKCHGGPTSAASSTLNLGIQYWTSRGIAVLDVNYGGSSGFGRAYRDRLQLNWGVVDVDDCINGAKFLAEHGRVDANRMVISGGSAGGYTTLAALVFHDVFSGGASYYGVSDIAALARDTHKFESHYLDWLIGPYPQDEALYRERSPLFHAERLSRPVIFFQGDEDPVVPPNQTEAMVEALRRRGTPVGYFLFSGEQHGFRKAANIQRALDAELYFYAVQVFGTGLRF